MKIELAQIDITLGDKERNLNRAIKLIQSSNAELILFPELFTTGFDFANFKKLSENVPGETTDAISDVCGGVFVGGTIIERDENKIYNTFVLVGKDGILAKYRKIHLFEGEKNYFSQGDEIRVVDTKLGKLALAICYDIRFPELFREFMKQNAEVVIVSAEFPDPREEHWRALLRARAIENQYFVIATNRVGRDPKHTYFGGSVAIAPWGDVIVSGGNEESILKAEIDISDVVKIRREFPVLGDALESYKRL